MGIRNEWEEKHFCVYYSLYIYLSINIIDLDFIPYIIISDRVHWENIVEAVSLH